MAGKSKELRAGALRAKIKGGLVHLDRGQPWAQLVCVSSWASPT
jgi:hypothetical protein